ncbi:MAG: DHHW family protein, partial [Lachnospiraceae bacterium]
ENDVEPAKETKKRFPYRSALGAVICGLVLGFSLLFFVLPKDVLSEQKEKALEKLEDLSLENILNSRYVHSVKSYAEERFPFSDSFKNAYGFVRQVSGMIENNGIYLRGKDGFAEDVVVPDEEKEDKIVQQLTAFAEAHPKLNIQFLLVPNAASICRSEIAVDAPVADQNVIIDSFYKKLSATSIATIDVRQALRAHSGEYLYYRTDPRWTMEGARIAFEAASSNLGIRLPKKIELFTFDNGKFVGTLATTFGMQRGQPDEILGFRPKKIPGAVVYTSQDGMGRGKKLSSIYDKSWLGTENAYNVYFGGDWPRLRLTNKSAKGDRRLLLVKDSYANCFLPFLTSYYKRIDVVDARYFTGSLEALMEKDKLTEVLFLFNANTLFSEGPAGTGSEV